MRPIHLLCALSLLVGVGSSAVPRGVEPKDYKKWVLVTPEPLAMDPVLVQMCAVSPSMRGRNGHDARFFRVFVTPSGENAMRSRKAFPVGASIVKEKLTRGLKVELLTVMTKHPKGFNKRAGDWDFYVTDAGGKRISAPKEIENCVSCHAREDDMVFRTYVRNKS